MTIRRRIRLGLPTCVLRLELKLLNSFSDKPSYEDYTRWYEEWLGDDLGSGKAERWYELVTDAGIRRLQEAEFWQELQKSLPAWDANFKANHEGYSLFGTTRQPQEIDRKPFESALSKSFRRNVLDNNKWPKPPETLQSTTPGCGEGDPQDPHFMVRPSQLAHCFPRRISDTFNNNLL